MRTALFRPLTRGLSSFNQQQLRVETIPRSKFGQELYEPLYDLANSLVHEDFELFCRHCDTNDLCHVFSDANCGSVRGFQFWRHKRTADPAVQLLWGGKLRMHPSIRRRGLHLFSNLLCYERFSAPSLLHTNSVVPRFYRMGLVNLLAFNSLTAGIEEYDTYPFTRIRDSQLIVSDLHPFCDESGFRFDDQTGQVDVGQEFSKDTLSITADTGRGFWARPKVREFIDLNPRWEDRDVSIAWEWNAPNIAAVEAFVARKARETGTSVEVVVEE